eukprot:Em0013g198a
MACAVQSYNHQLATEVAELSNELGDNGFFATIPSSLNWPITCGGVELDFLPTEEECILAPSYYQEQQLSSTLPETKSTRPASLFELPGKGWWDESELAPSVYKTLKEREQSLSKIEYRSPQLMSRQNIVDYIFVVGDQVMVSPGTRFYAVTLMDQFMDRHSVRENRLKLLASACLMIAAKLEDLDDHLPTIDCLLQAAQTGPDPCTYTREEFEAMEMYICKFFNWCLTFASPAHFSGYFLKHCPDWARDAAPNLLQTSVLHHVAGYVERRLYYEHYTDYFIELGLKDYTFMQYSPSILAAMSVCAARVCLGVVEPWPLELESITSFSFQFLTPGIEKLLNKYPPNCEFVTIEWLTTSFVEGKPTQVTDRYRLFKHAPPLRVLGEEGCVAYREQGMNCLPHSATPFSPLAPVEHKEDASFHDALELLERYNEYLGHKEGDTRALAFRRASCVLKSLPRKVTHIDQVNALHCIGKHSAQVIEEILTTGSSSEVEERKNSEWFQCMEQVFTSIYGCGPATSDKWYKRGLRNIEDIRACGELDLTEMQRLGIQYFEQLSCSIPRSEVVIITDFIRGEVEKCFPGTSVEIVGGFRRGKESGHDIDLLLTHHDASTVAILLESLVDHLKQKGCVIHIDLSIGHNGETLHQGGAHKSSHTSQGQRSRVTFDHLDKRFVYCPLTRAILDRMQQFSTPYLSFDV